MGWDEVAPSDTIEAADWIPGRLHPFAQDVGSVVPTGFGAYARIFHPAWTSSHTQQATPARWSEVAAANGTVVHPEMQFHTISHSVRGGHPTAGWDGEPRLGVLPGSQGVVLAEILALHTATPGVCWFCLWEGYGYLHPGGTAWFVSAPSSMRWRRIRLWWLRRNLKRRQPRAPTGPRVRLPHRDYFLFRGSVAQGGGWEDGPNLWWPDDRAWYVASEIDFPYTYVGGTSELIEQILQHPELEALPATVRDGITYTSDKVNS